jgi:hypothetical protein
MTIRTAPIRINLRSEAACEAARIQPLRARTPIVVPARTRDGIPACTLRHPKTPGLHRSVVIFFVRTSIVDGSGRLVEELITAVEVRRETGSDVKTLFKHWRMLARSVCLVEVARRIALLSEEYKTALERARRRELQLAETAAAGRATLVQPGLFGRRANADRTPVEADGREDSLKAASSLLLARRSSIVLVLAIQ